MIPYGLPDFYYTLKGLTTDQISKASLGYLSDTLSTLRLLYSQFICKFQRINDSVKDNWLNLKLNVIFSESNLINLNSFSLSVNLNNFLWNRVYDMEAWIKQSLIASPSLQDAEVDDRLLKKR